MAPLNSPTGRRPLPNNPAGQYTFEVGGTTYTATPFSALEEIHVGRALAPLLLSALTPEAGRDAIIARLAKVAGMGAPAPDAPADEPASVAAASATRSTAISDMLALATSILQAASAASEETINDLVRRCVADVLRSTPDGGVLPVWDAATNNPVDRRMTGAALLVLVGHRLVHEFRDQILDYLGGLNLKPGPAFMAALNEGAAR